MAVSKRIREKKPHRIKGGSFGFSRVRLVWREGKKTFDTGATRPPATDLGIFDYYFNQGTRCQLKNMLHVCVKGLVTD